MIKRMNVIVNRIAVFIFLFLIISGVTNVSDGFAYTVDTMAKQAIIIDEGTGSVLYAKNADEPMHPSSMSKLMTMVMVFDLLKAGSLKLTDTFPVSEKAWRMQGSKMFVELGNQISLEDLIKGIIIQSGNDACIVVAEGLAGSEESFALQMNAKAKDIGLTHSNFKNSTGWSDPEHLTTARDLSRIANYIIHNFPDYYHYYSEREFVYHGIHQHNRNPLLGKNLGVDGMKTGHTDNGGYGVTISGVSPEGRRVIMVINGLASEKERAEEAEKLLMHAYRDFENVALVKKGQIVGYAEISLGKQDTIALSTNEDVLVTLPKARNKDGIKSKIVYTGPLAAPIEKGAHIADLKIVMEGAEKTIPLIASYTVEKLGFFGRIIPNLKALFSGHGSK